MSITYGQSLADTPLAEEQELSNTAPVATRFYRLIWRWHFYAGLFAAPIMLMLAITGSIYLFKPQLDAIMYPQHVASVGTPLSAVALLASAQAAYPDAQVTSYKPASTADQSAEFKLTTADERELTVFVNPGTGQILGERDENWNLQGVAVKLHGELMAGTYGDYLVELAASWGFVLLMSGLYLWWPRKGSKIWGVLLPRLRSKNKRIFWRDLHVVPGFWGVLIIAFLILTGLPWAGFWGNSFAKVWSSYPSQLWDTVPKSERLTGELNSATNKIVPWAAEQLPMPASDPHADHAAMAMGDMQMPLPGIPAGTPVNLDSVVALAQAKGVGAGYSVSLPDGEAGVYTIGLTADDPRNSRTMHIDQYNGRILANIGWNEYALVPKAVETGIALHEGRMFGPANQIVMLFAALMVVLLAVTGPIMWWKRRPQGRLGAPAMPQDLPIIKGFVAIILVLGVLFPMVGISLSIVVLLDWLIGRILRARQVQSVT